MTSYPTEFCQQVNDTGILKEILPSATLIGCRQPEPVTGCRLKSHDVVLLAFVLVDVDEPISFPFVRFKDVLRDMGPVVRRRIPPQLQTVFGPGNAFGGHGLIGCAGWCRENFGF